MNKYMLRLLTLSSVFVLTSFPAAQPFLTNNIGIVSAQENIDFESLRHSLVEETPMLQSQMDQISDDQLQVSYKKVQTEVPTGGDIATLYHYLLNDYPQVFKDQIEGLKNKLIELGGLDAEVVEKIDPSQLLFIDHLVQKDRGEEDLTALIERLKEEGLLVNDDQLDLENIKQNLLESTPIDKDQISQIADEDLIELANEVNQNGGDPATVFNRLLVKYPELFKNQVQMIIEGLKNQGNVQTSALEQLDPEILLWENYHILQEKGQVDYDALADKLINKGHVLPIKNNETRAQMIRQELLQSTPIIEEQLQEFSDDILILLAEKVNKEGGDPSTVFNHLVQTYPDVFAHEVQRLEKIMIEQYGLDADKLKALADNVILWENYRIKNRNEGQESFSVLADQLVKEYHIPQESLKDIVVDKKETTVADINNQVKSALPQTGESQSVLPVLMASILGLFGIRFIKE
ncbi:LPXTG cell wall anchor domain-containing protein [Facklamia miroungae]|uniref:LPXTG-motif cell wall anchor domain-containing protein n=1 Tax=Facklamia miroungae TaxID=120956 RepID=A0A1G7QJQ5_9LACT|nr:LPXTG cell wall anchor domain-containing protein [Facklamia miroungae]NKZ28966.1 LPXTG cell wall anchor domain-containing protein [Facklamia miroungae]SDF98736.1 LPXTG-motif cell wall anchor domain-containing protein [Facklamia miroungae]